MKPTNHDSRELLQDIFAPEHPSSAVSAEEVLRLVQHAREARQRRRRFSAVAAVFLMSAIWAVTFLPSRSTNSSRTTVNVPVPSAPIGLPSSITPPIVEHVDDDRMLALLDEAPAALVRWPDGRRTLLLLVTNQPAN
jgi:hypothetical protein